jgi:ATP-dependent helicase/nuclease subunit B
MSTERKRSLDPFVDLLARLAVEHRTRAKWVFVPTHAIGRMLGDRLVLEGTDWANLRFVTPLDVALRMGAPFLVERGIDPSEEGLGPALMMRLLTQVPQEHGYFQPLADQPTLAEALWATVRELRMAGIGSQAIAPEHFTTAAKGSEFCALYTEYERFLATNGRGDLATVYEEAMRHPDWCPIQPADAITELPGVVWAPLQRRLIDLMPGERIAPRATAMPGVSVPRRLETARVDRVDPDASAPFRYTLSVSTAPAVGPAQLEPVVEFFHAGGRDAETEEVCRRIIASGVPLDQVEIACASPEYASLAWEKACRYDWPVTLDAGLPAAVTRPGRALLAFVLWIESDFAAGLLRRLLESGDVTLGDELDLAPGQASRILVKAEPAWGRRTYDLSLLRLAARYRKRAAQHDRENGDRDALSRKADAADRVREWIHALIDSIPDDAGSTIELQRLVNCATVFVESYAAKKSKLDHAAAGALRDAIADLEALGDVRCPLSVGLRFLRERVGVVTIGADRSRPGHLHVSTLLHAGYSGRPHLFIVGLEEGRVFPTAGEDPVLLDGERRQINADLRLSSDRIEESVYGVLNRLATAAAPGACVTLSYSCRDIREFRQTYPSWVLLQAFRAVKRRPSASYHDLAEALGEPKSNVPDSPSGAIADEGWWLSGLRDAGPAGEDAVAMAYPALAAGRRAESVRATNRFTECDGYVPEAGTALDPCCREWPVSVTALESAAECPFRYFLERGLELDAIDQHERDTDQWLDPLTRGSLLHELYAVLLRRWRAGDRPPNLSDDLDWLVQEGRKALDRVAVEMPPASVEVRDRETADFLEDVALFVRAECDREPAPETVGVEVAFGRWSDGAPEPLATPEPLAIELGHGLTLKVSGRIDRIDRIGPNSFEVVDYKTGGYWPADWKGVFAGGRRLQHAIYGLAATQLLRCKYDGATVQRGVYYFSSAKGGGHRCVIARPSRADVEAVLNDLRRVIAKGLFTHTPDENDCKWCDFGAACRPNAVERAAVKLGDPVLAPYVELTHHD